MSRTVTKTASQATANWRQRMGDMTTSQNYIAGINACQVNPMQLAAAQKDAYVRGVQNNQNKWADRLNATPIQLWKTNAVNVGAPRIATGIIKGTPKYQQFAAKYAPVWQQMKAAAQAIQGPKGMQRATQRWQAAVGLLMQAAGNQNQGGAIMPMAFAPQ